jgi:hypothetical protein|tara:strand:- start:158 stop:379 length:222 start_codon:yes stop_codon:yes gene_type:complete
MEMWMNEIWLLVTAITFTAVGWRMGTKSEQVYIIESTIDSLIEDGYLKVKPNTENEEVDIYKWREWLDDQDPR